MTAKSLIPSVIASLALHAVLLQAESVPADTFDPARAPEAGGGDPRAPLKPVLIMPDDKSSEKVKNEDRDPFGLGEDALRGKGEKSSNEENRILGEIAKLRASGIGPGEIGLRLLLGDMILTEGEIMPAVVKDQALALRVGKITRKAVELIWLEKKNTGLPPRVVTVPIDLRPSVRYVRHGQPEAPKRTAESAALKRANAVEVPKADFASPSFTPEPGKAAAARTPLLEPPPAAPTADAPAPGSPPVENSALKFQPVAQLNPVDAPATGGAAAGPAAAEPPPPAVPPKPEPASWQRALGLMDNLAKVAEEKK